VSDGTYIKKNWVSISNLNENEFNIYGEKAGFEDEDDEEDYGEFDIDKEFEFAPNSAPYMKVLEIIKSYENDHVLKSFKNSFPKFDPIDKHDYYDFATQFMDDMSEVVYIKSNWISMFDEDIFDKAGLAF
jgi:hypothetical protein